MLLWQVMKTKYAMIACITEKIHAKIQNGIKNIKHVDGLNVDKNTRELLEKVVLFLYNIHINYIVVHNIH